MLTSRSAKARRPVELSDATVFFPEDVDGIDAHGRPNPRPIGFRAISRSGSRTRMAPPRRRRSASRSRTTFLVSLYGMNFDSMPDLHGTLGYAYALTPMAIGAIVPAASFNPKGRW